MLRALALAALLTLTGAGAAEAQNPPSRMALIICVDDYEDDSESNLADTLPDLDEPCHDANLLAARLALLGWDEATEIRRLENPKTEQMLRAFRALSSFLNERPGRFGFVYMAGHGAEINNRTYLFEHMAQLNYEAAAAILRVDGDRVIFRESAIELSTDVFADLTNCFCDVIVVVDACRNDPVAFTRLNADLTAALNRLPATRAVGQGEIVVTAPQRHLLRPGLGALYATSTPGPILDQSPTRLALMLDTEMRPNLTIHQSLSLAATRVQDQSRLTPFPQSPSLSYTARDPFLCFNPCPRPSTSPRAEGAWPALLAQAGAVAAFSPIRYETTPPDPALRRTLEIIREPSDPLAARNQGAITIDVFWCEAGGEHRYAEALAYAQRLSALGSDETRVANRPLGHVRLRPLGQSENDTPGYRLTENVIHSDYEAPAEGAWARRLRSLDRTLAIRPQRSASPDYVSVFFCEGAPRMRDGPRLWIQIPTSRQRTLATNIALGLRNAERDLWIEDNIEIASDAPRRSQLRYYNRDDAEVAARLAAHIEAQGLLSEPLIVRRHSESSPYIRMRSRGMMELWIGRDEAG